jgi:hypothetical protein
VGSTAGLDAVENTYQYLSGNQTYIPLFSVQSSHYTDSELVTVTLRLAVYCQSVRLGDKPLENHDQNFYFPTEHLRS